MPWPFFFAHLTQLCSPIHFDPQETNPWPVLLVCYPRTQEACGLNHTYWLVFLFCFWYSEICVLVLVVAMFLENICDVSSTFAVIFGGRVGGIFYINCQCQLNNINCQHWTAISLNSNLIAGNFIWTNSIRSSWIWKWALHESCKASVLLLQLQFWVPLVKLGRITYATWLHNTEISFFNPLASWCLKSWEVF